MHNDNCEWEDDGEQYHVTCPKCGHDDYYQIYYDECPKCGAYLGEE